MMVRCEVQVTVNLGSNLEIFLSLTLSNVKLGPVNIIWKRQKAFTSQEINKSFDSIMYIQKASTEHSAEI